MICTIINDRKECLQLPNGEVLLDVLRNHLQLKGTKEGCREGDCGSCIVLLGKQNGERIDYRIVNSCMFPLGDAAKSHVVTIEGINGENLHPIQQAFVDENASQCGFCTPGFIISMLGYLLQAEHLDTDDAKAFLSGNICRCTGYSSIIRATEKILAMLDKEEFHNSYPDKRVPFLVENNFLPEYFANIFLRLTELPRNIVLPDDSLPVIAGGTDVYVQKGDEVIDKNVYLLSNDEQFKGITIDHSACIVKAASTITELEDSELIRNILPHFHAYLKLVSCPSIRNRATVGGNIMNASPIGDLTIMLLALNASVELKGKAGNRKVPLGDFFLGYKQMNIKPDELLYAVHFPLPPKQSEFHFEKISRRVHLDIAGVNSASLIVRSGSMIHEIRLSAGGVAPIPLYLSKTSEYLKGKELNDALISDALQIALDEISPISDVRGSSEYKRILLRQQIQLHLDPKRKCV